MNVKDFLFDLIPLKNQLGKRLCSGYIDSPVFVVGSGRSGTTAVADCINQHQLVKTSRNEMPLGLHLLEMLSQVCDGPQSDWYQESINISVEDLISRNKRLLFESVWGPNYGLRRALGVFQGGTLSNARYKKWSAKLFPLETQVDAVRALFAEVKFVYVVRNGVDVVNSMSHFGAFKEMSFADRCHFWASAIDRYNYLNHHHLAITIRHENFVLDPETEIRKICDHIKIDYSAEMLERAANTLTHSLGRNEDCAADVKETFEQRPNYYASWSSEERSIFDRVCGTQMAELGYSVSN